MSYNAPADYSWGRRGNCSSPCCPVQGMGAAETSTVSECRVDSWTSCPDSHPGPFPFAVPHRGRWPSSCPRHVTPCSCPSHLWPLQRDCLARWHCHTLFPRITRMECHPGSGTLPKAPTCSEREKDRRWLIAVISCRMIRVATEEVNNSWALTIWWAWAGCPRWCWLPMRAVVARSLGKGAFWPHEASMCSLPPSALLFLDGGTKIAIEEYGKSCQGGCCAVLQEVCFKMFNVSYVKSIWELGLPECS